jgi:hypothetical protein
MKGTDNSRVKISAKKKMTLNPMMSYPNKVVKRRKIIYGDPEDCPTSVVVPMDSAKSEHISRAMD